MAWIDDGSRFVWDVSYSRWSMAMLQAQKLQEQEQIFCDVAQSQDGEFLCITSNDIGAEHSSRCRCAKCWEK